MKILVVAPGDSLHTARWINRLIRKDVECIFYDMTQKGKMHPMDASKIFRLEDLAPSNYSNWLRFGKLGQVILNLKLTKKHRLYLQRIIEEEKPDLVHLHWLFHSVSLAVSKLKSIPIISTPWGSDLLTPEYKVKSNFFDKLKHRYVVTKVVRNSNAFCCDAPHMKDSLIKLGANAIDVDIIYFGTDINVFSPSLRNESFWDSFGLASETVKIISNRVLADMYDIETFIRAAKRVLVVDSNVDFVIAGGGPSSEKLKAFSIEQGLEQKILFTGRLDDETFASATRSSDIYVSTSPTDGGIAASVAEAMSSGVPVLITNFGDNPGWLKSESAGYLFDSGDDEKLSELILKLTKDEGLRNSMGLIGRGIVERENNAEIETLKVISLYKRMAAQFQ
jgi:L-malate glycosyltransferase